jgi:hypothetical protein
LPATVSLKDKSDGGGLDLSQDDLGDVAGVVAAVDTDVVEETRLPKDNHELVRESAMLLLGLTLALGPADTAEHAAHDVDV